MTEPLAVAGHLRARRWGRLQRLLVVLVATVALLCIAAVAGLWAINTAPGHAFVARQFARIAPQSGLTISVGSIDGSLFRQMTLHDLRIGDPHGIFFVVPTATLHWRPEQLLLRRVVVHQLTADRAYWRRLPKLRPTKRQGPILPAIDVELGRLELRHVLIDRAVVGKRQIGRLAGTATIRSGRALVDARASTDGSGDRILLRLDAEPDRDRFDVDAAVTAPAAGVLTTMLGLDKPLDLHLRGDGRWRNWRGIATAHLSNAALANLMVRGTSGRFSITGTTAPGLILGGLVRRLSNPTLRVAATALLVDRQVETTLRLSSAQLRLAARGTLDLADGRFDDVVARAWLLQPSALLRHASGRDIALAVTLDGRFTRPTIDYVFTAPRFALATTTLEHLRIAGRVSLDGKSTIIPATATARRVTGVGPFLQGILTNFRAAGPLQLRGLLLYSDALALRSDRLSGTAAAQIDLRSGRYNILVAGALPRYRIPGFGLVDVTTRELKIIPSADGRNPHLTGRATAQVVQLDSRFFRWLLEGLPTIDAAIDIPPGGNIFFSDARLVAPALQLAGSGSRARDGTFHIAAAGQSRRWGPAALDLVGPITAPVIDLRLTRPGLGVGLAGVVARFVPAPDGWAVAASGRTGYGPAALRGRLVTHPEQPLIVDVTSLQAFGMTGRGPLRQTRNVLSGTLALAAPGLAGTAALSAAGDIQRIVVDLAANDARLADDPETTVAQGSVAATILLTADSPTITGRVLASGIRRGQLTLSTANVALDYRAGQGKAAGRIAGVRGAPFSAEASVALAPERIEASGSGTIAGQPIRLAEPAVLTRTPSGWRLDRATLLIADGSARIAGRFGDEAAIDARLDAVGLGVLELLLPNLALSGKASGTISAALPADGGLPEGRLNLRVHRFSRAGLTAISLPIDLAIAAALQNDAAALRAVVQRGSKIVGRAQAQLRPIPGQADDGWAERLLAAPLVGQIRFSGPAEALWPLAGVDAFDVRGPVTVAADLGGRLGEPRLRGRMHSRGARIESPTLGTIVTNVALDSRFDASQLELTNFAGTAGKNGRVSGTGSVDLSAIRGFPVDLRLVTDNAQILRRDDLRATASGPIRLRSDERGGVVSGDLRIDQARFRIGRTSTEAVSEMAVREIGTRPARAQATRLHRPTTWRLAVDAVAARNVAIEGFGLESEWSAALKLSGPADAPRLTGAAELIRGTYEFAGKRFALTRGRMRFDGDYPPDPVIDIAAEARVEGLTATLRIGGTALKPEIAFSSVPALPEDEVLSRILFGTSVTALSAPEALQLASAVAALRQGNARNLDVFGAVRRGLGIDRLRILPGDTTLQRGASVAVGEYVGDRLYVEVASDAQGYTATQIEVALTRSLSILSQVATFGGTSVNLKWSRDY